MLPQKLQSFIAKRFHQQSGAMTKPEARLHRRELKREKEDFLLPAHLPPALRSARTGIGKTNGDADAGCPAESVPVRASRRESGEPRSRRAPERATDRHTERPGSIRSARALAPGPVEASALLAPPAPIPVALRKAGGESAPVPLLVTPNTADTPADWRVRAPSAHSATDAHRAVA